MNKKKSAALQPHDGEYGIENLSQLIKFITIAIQKTSSIDTDGNHRISLLEGLSVITTLGFKIPAVCNAFPESVKEWRDLSEGEIDQLVERFKGDFDLPGIENGRIKAIILKSIDIIVDNYNHVQDIREILGD